MVYHIRNKGFNHFSAALNPRVFTARKTKIQHELSRYVTLQVHMSKFNGMRILHNYRNISRASKQFLMGDKLLEMTTILTLKEHFFRPMNYESPFETSFYLGRTMADILDKHYTLFAQNQHPLQLAIYEEHNQFLRQIHDEKEGETMAAINDRLQEVQQQREAALATEEGESLSTEDLSDIYIQSMGEHI